jgi:hypothetical protein
MIIAFVCGLYFFLEFQGFSKAVEISANKLLIKSAKHGVA